MHILHEEFFFLALNQFILQIGSLYFEPVKKNVLKNFARLTSCSMHYKLIKYFVNAMAVTLTLFNDKLVCLFFQIFIVFQQFHYRSISNKQVYFRTCNITIKIVSGNHFFPFRQD